MKYRISILVLLLAMLSAPATASPKAVYSWTQLTDGIEYATWSFAISEGERTAIHAFLIDPQKLRIDVVKAQNELEGSTAMDLALREKALLVINGGFFTPEHKSIGLIIKNGRELNPIHKTSWWSIFAVGPTGPAIYNMKEFGGIQKDMKMALQVGPRLVVAGDIPKFKESVAARSAIGITNQGKVVIAITQGPGISMAELAHRMSASRFEGGLECPNAMALDGGSSSQIYAKTKKFELSMPGLAMITNGLAVFPKQANSH
jgi:uncharacterized protein YigE (DUF2233 family)